MNQLDQLIERLEARRTRWPDLAKEAGVHLSTIYKICGNEQGVTLATLEKLTAACAKIRPPRT